MRRLTASERSLALPPLALPPLALSQQLAPPPAAESSAALKLSALALAAVRTSGGSIAGSVSGGSLRPVSGAEACGGGRRLAANSDSGDAVPISRRTSSPGTAPERGSRVSLRRSPAPDFSPPSSPLPESPFREAPPPESPPAGSPPLSSPLPEVDSGRGAPATRPARASAGGRSEEAAVPLVAATAAGAPPPAVPARHLCRAPLRCARRALARVKALRAGLGALLAAPRARRAAQARRLLRRLRAAARSRAASCCWRACAPGPPPCPNAAAMELAYVKALAGLLFHFSLLARPAAGPAAGPGAEAGLFGGVSPGAAAAAGVLPAGPPARRRPEWSAMDAEDLEDVVERMAAAAAARGASGAPGGSFLPDASPADGGRDSLFQTFKQPSEPLKMLVGPPFIAAPPPYTAPPQGAARRCAAAAKLLAQAELAPLDGGPIRASAAPSEAGGRPERADVAAADAAADRPSSAADRPSSVPQSGSGGKNVRTVPPAAVTETADSVSLPEVAAAHCTRAKVSAATVAGDDAVAFIGGERTPRLPPEAATALVQTADGGDSRACALQVVEAFSEHLRRAALDDFSFEQALQIVHAVRFLAVHEAQPGTVPADHLALVRRACVSAVGRLHRARVPIAQALMNQLSYLLDELACLSGPPTEAGFPPLLVLHQGALLKNCEMLDVLQGRLADLLTSVAEGVEEDVAAAADVRAELRLRFQFMWERHATLSRLQRRIEDVAKTRKTRKAGKTHHSFRDSVGTVFDASRRVCFGNIRNLLARAADALRAADADAADAVP